MQEEIIGKNCLSTALVSGLYPKLNFGKKSLEVGPVFWTLLSEGAVVTHCYQLPDISEYYLEQLVGSELIKIETNKSETNVKIGDFTLRLNGFKNDHYEHYSIFSELQNSDDVLKKFLAELPDLSCDKAVNTFGSTVLIDFGEKEKGGKYPFTIMIETSNWSIKNNDRQISMDDLIGTKLIDIKIDLEKYESRLMFDNGSEVNTKPSGIHEPHWTLSLNGKHLTYGPKNIFTLS